MLDMSTPKGRLIAAALRLGALRPWSEITLLDIAEAAEATLMELRREFASKGDILAAFGRAVDDEVLKRIPKRTGEQAPRDRLFEVVMSRFDVLGPYKTALHSIGRSGSLDPQLLRSLLASQQWMLEAAGIGSEGVGGSLKAAGLAAVYASVFRTWLEDDDPGLARTMAALDRRLRRGEGWMNSLEDANETIRRMARALRPEARRPASPPAGSGNGSTTAESL
ncbi:MAG: TetR/AcrR family transcriptional regulator [Hyphomicrobiaceae bacterium]